MISDRKPGQLVLSLLGLAGIRGERLRLKADTSPCTLILEEGDAELPEGPLELFGGIQAKTALFSFENRETVNGAILASFATSRTPSRVAARAMRTMPG